MLMAPRPGDTEPALASAAGAGPAACGKLREAPDKYRCTYAVEHCAQLVHSRNESDTQWRRTTYFKDGDLAMEPSIHCLIC